MPSIVFDLEVDECCTVMKEVLDNHGLMIAIDPEDMTKGVFINHIGQAKNLYVPDLEDFIDAQRFAKIKFCPFCVKEFNYDLMVSDEDKGDHYLVITKEIL